MINKSEGPYDLQFTYIIEAMKSKFLQASQHSEQNVGVAYAMYELVRDFILNICKGDFYTGKIFICGGIQINMLKPCEDFFETLFFQVWENGTKTMDLMPLMENEMTYYDLGSDGE